MRRYVKVLATGALLGTQALPGYVSVAGAQNAQLPPVTISGSSSGGSVGYAGSGLGFYASSYSGGGSLSGGPPEAEAFGKVPAPPPPPKPAPDPQKLKECQDAFDRDLSAAQQKYSIGLSSCVASKEAELKNWWSYALAPARYNQCVKDRQSDLDRDTGNANTALAFCKSRAGG